MANIAVQFPDTLSYGFSGGPTFSTNIVITSGGWEQRQQNWESSRKKWNATQIGKNRTNTDTLIAFFRAVKGRQNAFLFRDQTDYQFSLATGILGTGVGTGLPTYQLNKKTTAGAYGDTQKLTRPESGTLVVQRNGSGVTFGGSAGNVAADYTTGILTFVADASSAATAITPGATTSVTLTTNPGTLTAGKLLYLSGFTGADASLVNGKAHTINSVSGSGPYVFVLATNTNGKTITLGSGNGYKYPQVADVLTCSGQFFVPTRFDTDEMNIQCIGPDNYQWGNIPMIEVRE
jgi:uncharacterized protein (TIGR02217 family)